MKIIINALTILFQLKSLLIYLNFIPFLNFIILTQISKLIYNSHFDISHRFIYLIHVIIHFQNQKDQLHNENVNSMIIKYLKFFI
jgi:hypothetical protein